jgi:hypothetical protein
MKQEDRHRLSALVALAATNVGSFTYRNVIYVSIDA